MPYCRHYRTVGETPTVRLGLPDTTDLRQYQFLRSGEIWYNFQLEGMDEHGCAALGCESNGVLTNRLQDLEECGFIRKYLPIGGVNGGIYQLILQMGIADVIVEAMGHDAL